MGDRDYDPAKAYGSMRNAYALYMKCHILCEYARVKTRNGEDRPEIDQRLCADVAARVNCMFNMLHNRFLWALFGEMNYAALMANAVSLYTAIHNVDFDKQRVDIEDLAEDAPNE